jgi:UDP-3-O-[3-hydroxymyristoyl] glucosamine N-acyltransferase
MISVSDLSELIDCSVEGNSELLIEGVGDLRNTHKNFISFLSDKRYYKFFKDSASSVVIVRNDFSEDRLDKTLIRVENPVFAYIKILEYFDDSLKIKKNGIHKSSIISNNTNISSNCFIGPFTTIDNNVEIKSSSFIGSSCYIGKNVKIGKNSKIKSNVSIYDGTEIGDNVIIESGTIVGTNGFGLTTYKDQHFVIPHKGKVIIEDNVWIGANCAIDRGTINNTIIGFGTKMDNLIQIAHNVQIGKHCIIAGHTAIAGSTTLGNYVTVAGKVGIIGHLKIGNKCTIASMSQVTKSLSDNSFVSGIPARDHKKSLKLSAIFSKLDLIYNDFKNNRK